MARREHPAPLPGIAKVRIIAGDDETSQKIVSVLRAYFTCTEPAGYSGGRAYFDVDARPIPPQYPEAD
ncbi:hypothetical protein [Streptomyces scopuliridis]|uniref:hypothetical protein n=1 Tax=Streptomyces scopuliridis TaxID=452529 RepID=UPI00342862ED